MSTDVDKTNQERSRASSLHTSTPLTHFDQKRTNVIEDNSSSDNQMDFTLHLPRKNASRIISKLVNTTAVTR